MSSLKNYTMQDIATAAGVSRATVSYVLNGKTNTSISEETKKRVLEAANLFNYIPNISAKSLSKPHIKLIGILLKSDSNDLLTMQYFHFINQLNKKLNTIHFNVILLPDKEHYTYVDLAYDTIIIINASTPEIESIGHSTFSPLILIDSAKEHSLLHTFFNDYRKAIQHAIQHLGYEKELVIIFPQYQSTDLCEFILNTPCTANFHSYTTKDDLERLFKHATDKSFIVLGEFAGTLAENYLAVSDFIVICDYKPVVLSSNTQVIHFSYATIIDSIAVMIEALITRSDVLNTFPHLIAMPHFESYLL